MDQISRLSARLLLVACLLIAGVLIRGRASAEMSEANPTYAFASTFGAIGADDKHTCVVRPNGTVRCWGRDMELQLGNDAAMSNSNIPVTVSGLSDVVAIGSGIPTQLRPLVGRWCAVLGRRRVWSARSGLEHR